MAKPYRRKDSKYFWISPCVEGVQQPQSTRTTDYAEALQMLHRLEGKIADGLITSESYRVTFNHLADLIKRNYKIKKRRSPEDLNRRLTKHILPRLGKVLASRINTATISEYIERRQEENASNATINRELSVIKRAYNLGKKAGLVIVVPSIEILPEDNVRQGFFREDHFRSILRHANPILRDILVVAYTTGWRIASILALEWSNVDLAGNCIRLRVNQTKNRKATTFPLAPFPELREVFDKWQKETKKAGIITQWVFHRGGEPVRSIKTGWQIARRKAGVPGGLIHDFRRTAVRNLKRAGWSDTEIMNMVGLRTLSMLLRYSITTEEDILVKAEAMAKAHINTNDTHPQSHSGS